MVARWWIIVSGILVAAAIVATNRTQISSSGGGVWQYNTLTGELRHCWPVRVSDLGSPANLAKTKALEEGGFSDKEINQYLLKRVMNKEFDCSPWKK